MQNSTLSKKVKNVKGDFSRNFLLGTLRFKIPVSLSGSVNLGGGMGRYMGGEMDVDASDVSGGAHNIYNYKTATGFHFMLEYEHFKHELSLLSAKWCWGIGVKLYRVTYDLESMTQNGKSIPISQLPQSVKDETMELDGSGTDLVVFITMYL